MDIMNEMSAERFGEVDDFLAFVSIYDDEQRVAGYEKMLYANRELIRGSVCVEAGCGFGIFSEYLAHLGARKVYAIEANPLLFKVATERLHALENVEVLQMDIRDFKPTEPVDVLVQELFGQLLYDEDIFALQHLQFEPKRMLPGNAVLMGGLAGSADFVDDTVTPTVLSQLHGCLISGLFEDDNLPLQFPVIDWSPEQFLQKQIVDISGRSGDLLYLGLQIHHDGEKICQAADCDNWSYVWTPRAGDVFELDFQPDARGTSVHFRWLA